MGVTDGATDRDLGGELEAGDAEVVLGENRGPSRSPTRGNNPFGPPRCGSKGKKKAGLIRHATRSFALWN